MGYNITIVDAFIGSHAFTDADLLGNPAGVCLTDLFPSDEAMQAIAAEIGLSETAFIVPSDSNEYELRWMTPKREVDLCGHATMAAAHFLLENLLADALGRPIYG